MTKLEKIERDIEALPPKDVHLLSKWLTEFREQLWDKQIEAGSPALDALADEAMADIAAGRVKPL